MKTIYCDEAGFTGNRLWDSDQPVFAYSAVDITPAESHSFVAQVKQDFNLGTAELKGGSLCRKPRGQKVVMRVLEEMNDKAKVSIFDKKFALAAKFFEYVFEPVLSPISTVFYDFEFNKFIANGLYAHMRTNDSQAINVLENFEDSMRKTDNPSFELLQSNVGSVLAEENFVDSLMTFLICNSEKIKEEIHDLGKESSTKWSLELSISGLRSLLVEHGKDMQPMKVFCDHSKPLAAQMSFFDAMVGRTDRQYVKFGDKEHQITFNLNNPIDLVDSSNHAGIEIADVIASGTSYALRNPESTLGDYWRKNCAHMVCEAVIPDIANFEILSENGLINGLILKELVERSIRGSSLIEGMVEWVYGMREFVRENHRVEGNG